MSLSRVCACLCRIQGDFVLQEIRRVAPDPLHLVSEDSKDTLFEALLKVLVRNLLSLGTGLLARTGGEHPKMVRAPRVVLSCCENIIFISAWFFSLPKLTRLSFGESRTAALSCSERRPFLSDIFSSSEEDVRLGLRGRGFNVFERASALPERGAALLVPLVGRHVPSLRPRRSSSTGPFAAAALLSRVSSVRFEEKLREVCWLLAFPHVFRATVLRGPSSPF